MDKRIPEFRRQLTARLDSKRYEHSLSVSFTSMALAMRYAYDIDKAELAGLLHDCAKYCSDTELIEQCGANGIALSTEEQLVKVTIHAKYGAWLAKHQYHIEDEEILSAIRYHTTGRPAMSLLEKIVFTADYIEPRRNKATRLKELRVLAFEDLDQAVYEILHASLKYLEEQGGVIDSMTRKAFAYYDDTRVKRSCVSCWHEKA